MKLSAAEKAMVMMSGVSVSEGMDTSAVKKMLKQLPNDVWNSLMADVQGALDDAGKMIPTGTLNKALGKMVGR